MDKQTATALGALGVCMYVSTAAAWYLVGAKSRIIQAQQSNIHVLGVMLEKYVEYSPSDITARVHQETEFEWIVKDL